MPILTSVKKKDLLSSFLASSAEPGSGRSGSMQLILLFLKLVHIAKINLLFISGISHVMVTMSSKWEKVSS